MFKSLFKPRWKHSNPEVRAQSLEHQDAIPEDDLIELAQKDAQPKIRRLAINRLESVAQLLSLTQQERNPQVQTCLISRLCTLFEQNQSSNTADALSHWLANEPDQIVISQLLSKTNQVAIRQHILEVVTDQQLLAERALHDPVSHLRQQAVNQLNDPALLESVLPGLRKRDKQVYRLASERLKQMRDRLERPARIQAEAEALCEQLASIGQGNDWEKDRYTNQQIIAQWQTIVAEVNPELITRFDALQQRFHQELSAFEQQTKLLSASQKRRAELLERLETLARHLETTGLDAFDALDDAPATLAVLIDGWAKAGNFQDAEWERQFQQRTAQIRQRLPILSSQQKLSRQMAKLAGEVKRYLKNPHQLSERRLHTIQHHYQALGHPPEVSFLQQQYQELQQLQHQLQQQLHSAKQQRQQRIDQLQDQLQQLQKKLDDGQIQQAKALRQQIREEMDALGEPKRLKQQFGALEAELTRLQQMQHWSIEQQRQQLIEDAQLLPQQQIHPQRLAQEIRQLRERWKTLDRQDALSGRSLWDAFNRACEQAYEPCQQHFNEQQQQQQRNLERRQQLCDQIATFIQETAWESPDWEAIVNFRRKQQKNWQSIGFTHRHAWPEIRNHYQQLMTDLDHKMADERQKNHQERRRLVLQAQQLVSLENLDQAVERCKALSRQWKVTVPSSRTEEQAIWQQFRAACDAVFDRLHQQQHAVQQEQAQWRQQKNALLQELDHLKETNSDELSKSRHRLAELQTAWGQIPDLHPAEQKRLQSEWLRKERSIQHHFTQLEEGLAQQALVQLEAKAKLCIQLEELAMTDNPPELLAEIDQQWEQLPTLEHAIEQQLMHRKQIASQQIQDRQQGTAVQQTAIWQQNCAQLEQLCLELEILLAVDSPPDYRQQRMELQVARLSESMVTASDTSKNQQERQRELRQQWLLLGPVTQSDRQQLDKRWQQAWQQFKASNSES